MLADAILRPLKRLLHRGLSQAGFQVVRTSTLPFGYDVFHDIKRLCRQTGRQPSLFFDVGANVGQTSLRIHREFPAARVIAFEPTPAVFVELKRNVARFPAIKAHNLAIGAEAGVADLFVYAYSQTNSLVSNALHAVRFNPSSEKIQCPVTTLDEFCAAHGIAHVAVLKIDTEGYDLPILQGARGLISAGRIDFVYIEFNDIMPRSGASGGALYPLSEFLQPFGFRFIASYTDYVYTEDELFVVCNALFMRT
jgi:FkbM family methyltransferase